jgi:hypothetical protein
MYDAQLIDSEGKPMLCSCGKVAVGGLLGKESVKIWCEDHCPLDKYEAKMVYMEIGPNDYTLNTSILDDDVVLDLTQT